MNKLIFFSLFLVASMGFVFMPNTAYADSQLDILVTISQNTQEHIKKDIDKMNNLPQEIHNFYGKGQKQTSLLIQAVENEDSASAKRYFIDAMIAFKQASLAISESQSQKTQPIISDHSPTIKKYENNIKKLKIISTRLNADLDFEQIEQLLSFLSINCPVLLARGINLDHRGRAKGALSIAKLTQHCPRT